MCELHSQVSFIHSQVAFIYSQLSYVYSQLANILYVLSRPVLCAALCKFARHVRGFASVTAAARCASGQKKTCRRGPETGHRALRRQDCSVGRLCDGRSGSLSEDVGGRDFPHAALDRVAVPRLADDATHAPAFGCVGEPEVVGEAELHLAQYG